jgi:hypothetical protein
MAEENVVAWVKPELCTSRTHEVLNSKHTQSFTLTSDGNLKLKDHDQDIECGVKLFAAKLWRWI